MALQLVAWGAGLKDGKIKTSDGSLYDINAIVTANADPQQDSTEVNGDDEQKAVFISNITEEITVEANGISFDVIQAITGNTVSSSSTGMEVALGTDSQANAPYVEVVAYTRAKNADGTAGTLYKRWHKVQFTSIEMSQAGEQEFNITLTGTAYQTSKDITGASLASNRVATVGYTNP